MKRDQATTIAQKIMQRISRFTFTALMLFMWQFIGNWKQYLLIAIPLIIIYEINASHIKELSCAIQELKRDRENSQDNTIAENK